MDPVPIIQETDSNHTAGHASWGVNGDAQKKHLYEYLYEYYSYNHPVQHRSKVRSLLRQPLCSFYSYTRITPKSSSCGTEPWSNNKNRRSTIPSGPICFSYYIGLLKSYTWLCPIAGNLQGLAPPLLCHTAV